MIVCENVTKLFGADSGIRDINLQFSPGLIYGIVGYNGAGKTTLLRCIEGLYLPTSGHVRHDGVKTTNEQEFLPRRKKISFLPTEDYLYNRLTCMDNIELATILRTGKNKLLKETQGLIKYFELEPFLHKKVQGLLHRDEEEGTAHCQPNRRRGHHYLGRAERRAGHRFQHKD
jgi:ABC-type multidrug transport system ATPase subunit